MQELYNLLLTENLSNSLKLRIFLVKEYSIPGLGSNSDFKQQKQPSNNRKVKYVKHKAFGMTNTLPIGLF